MRPLIILAAAVAVASCSRPAMPPGSALAEATAGRIPGPAQSCVTAYPAENLHALDAQNIAYGYGKTIYINHFAAPCPAIEPGNTLIVDAGVGNEYCRGDRVRGREPGAIIAGPSCNLGNWVPYRLP
jgi:hypothetical protein